jgi:hypothetical protein
MFRRFAQRGDKSSACEPTLRHAANAIIVDRVRTSPADTLSPKCMPTSRETNSRCDQFRLPGLSQVHSETREMPMYTLVTARSDGAMGAQLKAADCDGRNDVAAGFPRAGDRVLPCNTRFVGPRRVRSGVRACVTSRHC